MNDSLFIQIEAQSGVDEKKLIIELAAELMACARTHIRSISTHIAYCARDD